MAILDYVPVAVVVVAVYFFGRMYTTVDVQHPPDRQLKETDVLQYGTARIPATQENIQTQTRTSGQIYSDISLGNRSDAVMVLETGQPQIRVPEQQVATSKNQAIFDILINDAHTFLSGFHLPKIF